MAWDPSGKLLLGDLGLSGALFVQPHNAIAIKHQPWPAADTPFAPGSSLEFHVLAVGPLWHGVPRRC